MPDELGPRGDEERLIRDYLGVLAPETFRGQPALPTAAPSIPEGPAPAGGPGRAAELTSASRRASASPAASQALQRALQALGLGATAIKGVEALLATPPPPLSPKTSDILEDARPSGPDAPSRGFSVPAPTGIPPLPEGAIATGVEAPAGAAVEPAAVAGAQTAEAAASPASTFSLADLGPYAAYLGPALSIAMRGARGDEPVGTQAGKAAVEAASAAGAVPTFGLSLLAPFVLQTLADTIKAPGLAKYDPLYALYSTDRYGPERQRAARQASAGLTTLGGTYEAAARSGDPEQVFHALRSGEAGGRVRSTLSLPPDVAADLGVPSGTVEWSSLSPEQFTRLLNVYQERPELIDMIGGSGDTPYLPQKSAQSVADSAARGARQLIQLLISQQAIQGMTPEPAPQTPTFRDLAAATSVAPAGGPADVRALRPDEQPITP